MQSYFEVSFPDEGGHLDEKPWSENKLRWHPVNNAMQK